jgi:hypothetical protein
VNGGTQLPAVSVDGGATADVYDSSLTRTTSYYGATASVGGAGTMRLFGNITWASNLTDSGTGGYNDYGNSEPVLYNTGTIAQANAHAGSMGTVFNDGTISIPRGIMYFDALTQSADGVVNLGVGGTTAQSGCGVPNLGSSSFGYGRPVFQLAGTVQLTLDPGYAPSDGSKYDVVTGMITDGDGHLLASTGSRFRTRRRGRRSRASS